MSVPIRGKRRLVDTDPHRAECKWETIRYALDSTPRTVRLCIIWLVASIPLCVITILVYR